MISQVKELDMSYYPKTINEKPKWKDSLCIFFKHTDTCTQQDMHIQRNMYICTYKTYALK